jgi:putative hydrolase of the HAD superfamily
VPVRTYDAPVLRAVFFDFGGVITESPLDGFARLEQERGLPPGFIASVNLRDYHSNAWARLERSEITPADFDQLFADESSALGHEIRGADVLAVIHGEVRPEMVAALDVLREEGYVLACLTNNVSAPADGGGFSRYAEVLAKFDNVVESSKVGARKPERHFYEAACERTGVQPSECVFLDDLGVNVKAAREMGMSTIKVTGAAQALGELAGLLGLQRLRQLVGG